jgi:hypothetical protein
MTLAPPPLDPAHFTPRGPIDADVVFATFFVSPGLDPDDYHSLRPDMRFARVLRQSHAHLRVHVAVLTDSATKLGGLGSEREEAGGGGESGGGGGGAPSGSRNGESSTVEVFRCGRIERARMGRNSYCNFAQMVAQIDYLDGLSSLCAAAGRARTPPVVFLDTDILVVGSIVERVFGGGIGGGDLSPSAAVPFGAPPPPSSPSSSLEEAKNAGNNPFDFDYCCTLSDSFDMPINFGIQFVAPGKTTRAADFLRGVCSVYDFSSTFTAGQEVRFFFLSFFCPLAL